jgi:prephenate dehydrogenase
VSGIRRIAIVGVGLIGGSLALALRARRPEILIHGITPTHGQAEAALQRGAVHSASARLEDVASSDLVVIATPLDAMRGVLASLTTAARGVLITDVGSVKTEVMGWARDLLDRPERFLGSHPMAGSEESGLEAARATLFEGAPWVFTPAPGQDLAPFGAWLECVRAIGATPIMMEAQEHDRRVALVSHLAFLLSSAYVSAIRSSEEPERTAALAGPGFRDMVRLAAGDPRLYAAVARANRESLRAAVDRFERALGDYRRLLDDGDPSISALFEESRAATRDWFKG